MTRCCTTYAGDSSLSTDAGPRDRHQRSSGSTTGWLLTKLRSPEGSTTQYQPGGAQSRTWPLGSSRSPPPSRQRGCGIGIIDVENKMLNYENKINKHLAKFGMTFAKNRTYRAPEICHNVNELTFLAKHRPLGKI